MKKTFITIALAAVLSLPAASWSSAGTIRVSTNSANVEMGREYTVSNGEHRITVVGAGEKCYMNNGDRVRTIRPHGDGDTTTVEVLSGQCQGRRGFITNAMIDVPQYQEVFTTGRWGDDVPVFRDQKSYFNARDRGKVENVVCRLKRGMHVEFAPYKDWGLGEVKAGNCKGWIDRGVIR